MHLLCTLLGFSVIFARDPLFISTWTRTSLSVLQSESLARMMLQLHPLSSSFSSTSSVLRSIPGYDAGDILSLALDHLKVAWIATDLSVHVDVLALVAHLLTGLSPLSRTFQTFGPQLFSHVLRLINLCCFIVRGETPNFSTKAPKVTVICPHLDTPRQHTSLAFQSRA